MTDQAERVYFSVLDEAGKAYPAVEYWAGVLDDELPMAETAPVRRFIKLIGSDEALMDSGDGQFTGASSGDKFITSPAQPSQPKVPGYVRAKAQALIVESQWARSQLRHSLDEHKGAAHRMTEAAERSREALHGMSRSVRFSPNALPTPDSGCFSAQRSPWSCAGFADSESVHMNSWPTAFADWDVSVAAARLAEAELADANDRASGGGAAPASDALMFEAARLRAEAQKKLASLIDSLSVADPKPVHMPAHHDLVQGLKPD